MTKEQMRKAQLCQLNIAKEIKRICEKHGIGYFFVYGTLLGAVRHKGFIPWDDDLDIGMLREDYDKFILICQKELGEEFFLQMFETDPYYGLPYSKIMKKGTIYKEEWAPSKTINGIFVDIFPIDDAPKNIFLSRLSKRIYSYYLRMLHLKLGYTGFLEGNIVKKMIKTFLRVLSVFYSEELLKKKLRYVLVKHNNKNSEYIHNFNSSYKEDKERMLKSWFEQCVDMEFEGEIFKVPYKYDEYLTHIYGDYMKLPPENERVSRHRIEQFGV